MFFRGVRSAKSALKGGRWLAVLAVLAVVVIPGAAQASPGLGEPVITFGSASPPEGVTLTASSAQFAFTYNRTPKQTRRLACVLSGPTASSGCDPLRAVHGGSSSGASYSGLANGRYALTVKVTLTNGRTTSAVRHFTVAASSCTAGTEDFSEYALTSPPATFSGGTLASSRPDLWSFQPPIAGYTGNIIYTGGAGNVVTVYFNNPVKSLSLLANNDPFVGHPVTLTGYNAANAVVGTPSSTDVSYATMLTISSTTANIQYATITSPYGFTNFGDMSWGC